jgi:hypothetical protein
VAQQRLDDRGDGAADHDADAVVVVVVGENPRLEPCRFVDVVNVVDVVVVTKDETATPTL